MLCLVAQMYLTLCNRMDCSPPFSSVHGDSPGKNIGGGCHALPQRILPTQGLNTDLLHCRILYSLSHQGSPDYFLGTWKYSLQVSGLWPVPSILYPASNLDWQFISYMILYMFQCHSPKSSHPLPLPRGLKVRSIHLCLAALNSTGFKLQCIKLKCI